MSDADVVTVAATVVTAAAMVLLVVVTGAYVCTTHAMVKELRNQSSEITRRDIERREKEILRIRHGLGTELKQTLIMIEETPGIEGRGRNYIRLPSQVWRATFTDAEAIPDPLGAKLLGIYVEVDRVNAITDLMLSDPHSDRNPVGENWDSVRREAVGPLRDDIHEAQETLEGLLAS